MKLPFNIVVACVLEVQVHLIQLKS